MTVRGDGIEVTFKQIAGLPGAAHCVCVPRGRQGGARAACGADQVWLPRGRGAAGGAVLRVKVGQRVKGAATVLAAMPQGEGL